MWRSLERKLCGQDTTSSLPRFAVASGQQYMVALLHVKQITHREMRKWQILLEIKSYSAYVTIPFYKSIAWFAIIPWISLPVCHFQCRTFLTSAEMTPKSNVTWLCLPCRQKTLWRPWQFCVSDWCTCLPIKTVPCILGAQKFLAFQQSPTHSSWKMITL